jgi:predicted PurR-regulated permease PerM
MRPGRTIVISTRTMLLFLVMVAVALLLFYLRDVLVTVFVAAVISAAMDPSIVVLEKRGLPRPAALAIIFFGTLGLIVAVLVTFVPLVVEQVQQLSAQLPDLYRNLLERLRSTGNGQVATAVENGVRSISQGAGTYARTFFGGAITLIRGVVSAFGVMVLTFYMVMQQEQMKRAAIGLAPPAHRNRVGHVLRTIEVRLGQWLRGQLLLGAVIGGVSYVGLLALHVKYALVLALLAGVTELVPIIGPIIGAIPAVLMAASDEPIRGLYVALMYLVIQQTESHILVPRVMSSTTGLNPIVVLVAVLAGARLEGIVGVLLAVPASLIAQTIAEDWRIQREAGSGTRAGVTMLPSVGRGTNDPHPRAARGGDPRTQQGA